MWAGFCYATPEIHDYKQLVLSKLWFYRVFGMEFANVTVDNNFECNI